MKFNGRKMKRSLSGVEGESVIMEKMILILSEKNITFEISEFVLIE